MKRIVLRSLELVSFSLIVGAANLLVERDPGFLSAPANPFLLLALVAAALYGKYWGFVSLAASVLIVAWPLPAAIALRSGAPLPAPAFALPDSAAALLAASVVGVWVFGLIRDSFSSRTERLASRLRAVSRAKGLLQRKMRAVEAVNGELEERVSRQSGSLAALYARVQELNTLNLDRTFAALLDIVQRFTGAARASIWEHRADSGDLRLASSVGWEALAEGDARETVLPVEGTIEGWVVRNNMVFSVRMLLEHDNLKRMDRKRNLITVPIELGRRVWGVLNIEDMPFVRYSSHTEKLLMMILALARPALEQTVEYEAIMRQADINPRTGLYSFAHFFSLLSKEIERARLARGKLSVLIAEVANFDGLVSASSEDRAYVVLARVGNTIREVAPGRSSLFHYKDRNQLALLLPELDYDGTSLLCLQLLARVSEHSWQFDGTLLAPELTLGYAALGEKQGSAEELLESAENLLAMQRV